MIRENIFIFFLHINFRNFFYNIFCVCKQKIIVENAKSWYN